MMIQAHLRRLHSPDVFDLEHYAPEDAAFFGILVQALIGPNNEPGEESFDFLVCTPRWLSSELSQSGYVFGRHYLLLSRYDYAVLWQAIQGICAQAQGPSWQAVATYLSRYGHWEFEDYQP